MSFLLILRKLEAWERTTQRDNKRSIFFFITETERVAQIPAKVLVLMKGRAGRGLESVEGNSQQTLQAAVYLPQVADVSSSQIKNDWCRPIILHKHRRTKYSHLPDGVWLTSSSLMATKTSTVQQIAAHMAAVAHYSHWQKQGFILLIEFLAQRQNHCIFAMWLIFWLMLLV